MTNKFLSRERADAGPKATLCYIVKVVIETSSSYVLYTIQIKSLRLA